MKQIASCFLAAALTTFALPACAGSAVDAPPTTEPTPLTARDAILCGHLPVSREAVQKRVPVSAISGRGRVVLSAALWDDGRPLDLPPEEGWYVATVTDALVVVMRDAEVLVNPTSGEMLRDREVMTVTWVKDAPNHPPGWYVFRGGMCALTVDLGDLTVPAIGLQSQPYPTAQELRLLVTEQSCNSGEDAEGRIEVVSVDETDDRVNLVLGVRPRDGAQACPSNPATPFIVPLSQPLGEREVMNATLAYPRILNVIG